MKTLICRFYLVVALVGLVLPGHAAPEATPERNVPVDRLERLEKRVNEMAERQEQFMSRLGAQQEGQGERPGMGQPMNARMRPQWSPPGVPGAPMAPQNMHPGRAAKGLHDLLGLLFLLCLVSNILLAVWIFTDIRKRGEGSHIFIALALVAGIPAALIYALTRIGDRKV